MQKVIKIETYRREALYDITAPVKKVVEQSRVAGGIVHVYVRGATAAVMIQENWDDSVQKDVVNFFKKIIPRGAWEHDRQDGNGDAHLKSGLVGPGETIPIIDKKIGLSTWQNIFLCEFDGPRAAREVVVTVIGA